MFVGSVEDTKTHVEARPANLHSPLHPSTYNMSDKSISYTHHAANTMAGLLGAGALYGAFVKGSKMSLVAGGLLASTYAASGYVF